MKLDKLTLIHKEKYTLARETMKIKNYEKQLININTFCKAPIFKIVCGSDLWIKRTT